MVTKVPFEVSEIMELGKFSAAGVIL